MAHTSSPMSAIEAMFCDTIRFCDTICPVSAYTIVVSMASRLRNPCA